MTGQRGEGQREILQVETFNSVSQQAFSSGYLGVSQNQGYLFRGPYDKDYGILESILGSPIWGNYQVTFS